MEIQMTLDQLYIFFKTYWSYVASAAGLGAIWAILKIIAGRVLQSKPSAERPTSGDFFKNPDFLSPPMQRAAYSDRMAYVLAEMSALAYFQFEGIDQVVTRAAEQAVKLLAGKNTDDVKAFLSNFAADIYTRQSANKNAFCNILSEHGFELIGDPFNQMETQGFLCRRNVNGEPLYLVLAFRGTEKKIEDWLTDANAIPHPEITDYRVHKGFYNAFNLVKDDVERALRDKRARDKDGKLLPLYITGHSLGGALALLATKYLASDVNGACYTYGAPRVADYSFSEAIKTPVYRVVNSSDIVPRVPPGAGLSVIVRLLGTAADFIDFAKPVQRPLRWLESKLDKLNGYRHHGDLRYLTDIVGGQFEKVRLLYNPPAIDRAQWFFKHIATSIKLPFRNHGLLTYRKKLNIIATRRNN